MERRDLETLVEMGFGPGRAAKALALTGNQGVEAAMDWLVAHEDEGGDPEPPPTFVGGPREEESETQKALSEAGQERERRRRGQELERLRQRHLEEQQRRAAEERRRDRDEERLARQRVREKIERDKAERARKFGSIPAASEPPPAPPAAPPPAGQRHYEHCRLQVRLPDGRALTQSFRAREPLAAVRLFVELHGGRAPSPPSPPSPRGQGDPSCRGGLQPGPGAAPPQPFELLTAFPRRRFTDDDMEKPLSELGLVPSAVLIVAKKEGS